MKKTEVINKRQAGSFYIQGPILVNQSYGIIIGPGAETGIIILFEFFKYIDHDRQEVYLLDNL